MRWHRMFSVWKLWQSLSSCKLLSLYVETMDPACKQCAVPASDGSGRHEMYMVAMDPACKYCVCLLVVALEGIGCFACGNYGSRV